MKANTKHRLALCAGLLTIAASAFASEHTLTTPPPSEFIDAENSVNVPLPTDEGRRIRLTLAFAATPSNAVQIAFGNDLNGSENLEPEETELVLGVDCGDPFVRDEVEVRGGGGQRNVQVSFEEQECDHLCPPSTSTSSTSYTFTIKQPRERWSLAKVTTHNLADTNLFVAAEFYNRGQVLFLR